MSVVNISGYFSSNEYNKRQIRGSGKIRANEVLEAVLDLYDMGGEMKIDSNDLGDYFDFFVDGKNSGIEKLLKSKFSEVDEVFIMPKVSGNSAKNDFFEFSDEQIKRYSRQIVLSEVGGKGQEKLLDSKVLVVGAGALGSTVLQYLSRAGIGKIGIVDSDEVELSNLQRQIIHDESDVGSRKVFSAKETIEENNSDIDVETFDMRLDKSNAAEIIGKDWDIVVDGADNFGTKFLLNDVCVLRDVPLSHAGILRFTGMVTTVIPGEAPCYRCFTPKSPPSGAIPSCQEAGVLGSVPGVLGSIQATEVFKYLLGEGNLLVGRFLVFNGKKMSFEEVNFGKNDDCPVCSKKFDEEDLKNIDYGESCSVNF